MKKSIALFIAVLFLCSCEDFLDRQSLDQVGTESFYKTASDANLAAIGMYSSMQAIDWWGQAWKILEIPSDNSTAGGNDPDFSPIDNFTHNPENGPNNMFWSEHYKLVTLANQVLQYVPDIEMDLDAKNSILGEARFLRAYAYFDLVRIYGAVPLVTRVPSLDQDLLIPRNAVDEVYALIKEDLEFAADHLPEGRAAADAGRATSVAAKALLAKVHLTLREANEALVLTREIVAANTHQLMSDPGSNWLKSESDNNAEAIFQIQYTGCGPGGTGNAQQAFFAPWGENITRAGDGWGSQIPTSPTIDNPGTTIKDLFDPEDLRAYHTIMSPGDEYPMINAEDGGYRYPSTGASRSGVSIKKYVIGGGADVCFMSTPQNAHVIRYADVLLSLVEAACMLNGGITVTEDAVDAYNQVRLRAGLSTVSVVTIDEVFDERRREFAFENQRWFDLLRSGNAVETMRLHGKQMQDFHVLFPIPAAEIAINPNLSQNPGY